MMLQTKSTINFGGLKIIIIKITTIIIKNYELYNNWLNYLIEISHELKLILLGRFQDSPLDVKK